MGVAGSGVRRIPRPGWESRRRLFLLLVLEGVGVSRYSYRSPVLGFLMWVWWFAVVAFMVGAGIWVVDHVLVAHGIWVFMAAGIAAAIRLIGRSR
jgi:hypothetical protein